MKQILYALVALVAVVGFTSCKEDNKGKVLDPLAKISIKPAAMPQSTASKANGYLSPVEVVRQTMDIVLINPKIGEKAWYNFGIADEQKDLITPKIMMWGMWVIDKGQLTPDFIEAKDVIFVTREQKWSPEIKDTVAYIPNTTLRVAEQSIKAAFDRGDYTEVYRLFDQAYRFTPINGADWLKLKAKGEN